MWTSHLWGEEPVANKELAAPPITLRNYSARYLSATHSLEVRFQMGRDKKITGKSHLTLVNSQGQQVFGDNVMNFGRYQKQIDLTGRGAGIYLLVISSGNQKITRRIAVY